MDWVLDHLQILIAVAAAIAFWLRQSAKTARGESEADADGAPQAGRNHDDTQDADRARRIREEIRRKIAERAAGGPVRIPEPAPEPPPLFRGDSGAPRPVARPLASRPEPAANTDAVEILERQQRLREQMESLERARQMELAAARAAAASMTAPAAGQVTPGPARLRLQDELRQKEGLRRAVLLREILGPPVGLR